MAQSAIDAFKETQSLAKQESIQRLNVKSDNCPFNTSGCLGEIQVGLLVIEVLEKTPIFSKENVRHDIMSQVLSGEMKLQAVEKSDRWYSKHRAFYTILRDFEDVLYNLKYRMKFNFILLDNFYVNLGSRFGMKDSREQVAQNELCRCFREYAKLFCKTDSAALWKNKTIPLKLKLHQVRQFLELQKADTYSGILNHLSSGIPTDIIEKTARHHQFVCDHNPTVKEKINFIYVNVVLSRLRLQSQCLQPYQKLIDLLLQVLREQIPISEILPLHFIAVMLLWPQQGRPPYTSLGKSISQVRDCYDREMREVYNGKRPIVHFFLGNKQGYERLVPFREIQRCVSTPEQFASMWDNGRIWNEKKVKELLCRITGKVKNFSILVDTYNPDLEVKVTPMFRSQLSGYADGSKVSFFTGFSVRGPLAFDIN